ncbi:hypothetical protein CHL78_018725, partial [Romboutsia weinsteinii]
MGNHNNNCGNSNNNCCNPCNPCNNVLPTCEDTTTDCCTKGIRSALLAIQSTVREMRIPGFSVDLLITTIAGVTYTVTIGSSSSQVRIT